MRTLALALAVLATVAGPALRADTEAPVDPLPYELESLAPGVWAALQPQRLWFAESNSLIVVGERAALVVDAQGSPAAVARLAREIRTLTEVPVRYLVFTHWHGDHTQGAGAYRDEYGPEVVILGHASLRRDIPERAVPALQEQAEALQQAIDAARDELAAGRGLEGEELDAAGRTALAERLDRNQARADEMAAVAIPTPDVAVTGETVIDLGGREVALRHLPGHTDGDLVVEVNGTGIVATGDLLDRMPFGGHGDLEAALVSLADLGAMDWKIAVPGHGGVIRGREHLALVRELWTFLRERVRTEKAAGRDADAARADLVVSPAYGDLRRRFVGDDEPVGRAFDRFVPETFDRCWESC